MIVGSGLLASAFSPSYASSPEIVVYAAGVSNSSCTDAREFEREKARIAASLDIGRNAAIFVYFSTCSVLDPELATRPYVLHKDAMERLAREHPGHLVIRLPQLAGHSPNPHTLLNYLYARISRSERYSIWANAARNVIDVDDVVKVARYLIDTIKLRGETVNIANVHDYPIRDIVATMERVCGKKSIHDAIDKGGRYAIDVQRILPLLPKVNVAFPPDYLLDVLRKYYGESACHE